MSFRDQLQHALGSAFRIDRELGRGGMSRVYLATETRFSRHVVIKVLPPELAASLSTDRFEREIRVAAGLQQANIVSVITSGDVDGLPWYAMPYIEGESLRERLDRGSIPVADATAILCDVAKALAHAHERGVVHRDVKPENILLSGGTAVVTDFGIAKAVSAATEAPRGATLTVPGTSLGTPAYMAPEQAAGDTVDHRADIYAWGILAYEMLGGAHPFAGTTTAQQMIAAQISAAPPPLATGRGPLAPGLETLVMQALAKDPGERPPSAREIVKALSQGGAEQPGAGAFSRRFRGRAGRQTLPQAALAIAAAAMLVWVTTRPPAAAAPATLAVLYMENLSPDTLDRYLADGLTEEMISRLGSVGQLRVKSRNAVQRFRDGSDRSDVAAALDVQYLVEGSVRRSGNAVRVTARLLESRSGDLLWEAAYDRAPTDMLALQEEIARAIATAIAGELGADDARRLTRRKTDDAVAYDQYLRGNFQLAQRTSAGMEQALLHYREALRRDPSFTEALAAIGYASALALDLDLRVPGHPHDSLLTRGLRAADHALRQDPTSSAAWMARAYLLSFADPVGMRGAPEAFERAIALDPQNAEALHQFGWILQELGEDSLAIVRFKQALAADPYRASTLWHLGRAHIVLRDYPGARTWLDSALRVDRQSAIAYMMRSFVNSLEGRRDAAVADGMRAAALNTEWPFIQSALAIAEMRSAATANGRRRADLLRDLAMKQRPPTVVSSWLAGMALTEAGEPDAALTLLEQAEPRGAHLAFDLRWPFFDPLRNHARFQTLERAASAARYK